MPWLLAARRKKLRHLLLLRLLKLRPLLLRLLMQSRLTPLLLLTLPSRLTPLLRLLTQSLLTLPLRLLMQSRLKPLRPSNLRIIFGKNRPQGRFFFVPTSARTITHSPPLSPDPRQRCFCVAPAYRPPPPPERANCAYRRISHELAAVTTYKGLTSASRLL